MKKSFTIRSLEKEIERTYWHYEGENKDAIVNSLYNLLLTTKTNSVVKVGEKEIPVCTLIETVVILERQLSHTKKPLEIQRRIDEIELLLEAFYTTTTFEVDLSNSESEQSSKPSES